MKKISIVGGLISGAIISILMGLSMMIAAKTNSEGSMLVGYASMLLAFSVIFVSIKNFRDKQNGGTISFGKAFSIGLIISVIASCIYVATWAVEYKYFLPDYMEKYAAHAIEKLKASGDPQASIDKQIEKMTKMMKYYKNPVFFTMITFSEIFPVGLIVSLISALILKKKNAMQTIKG